MIARQLTYFSAAGKRTTAAAATWRPGWPSCWARAWPGPRPTTAADPRRQRLRAGIQDQPHPVRRAHPQHLRGCRRDPGAGHRAPVAGAKAKSGAFTEDDWSDTAHPKSSAYYKSKTLAERAAWDFVAEHPDMQLTTINPALVLGEPMDGSYGTSLELIERILGGKDPMMPDIGFGVVDVADISAMHIAALEKPESIGHRFIGSNGTMTMPRIAQHLAARHPDRKIATRIAPKFLLRILSLFDPSHPDGPSRCGRRAAFRQFAREGDLGDRVYCAARGHRKGCGRSAGKRLKMAPCAPFSPCPSRNTARGPRGGAIASPSRAPGAGGESAPHARLSGRGKRRSLEELDDILSATPLPDRAGQFRRAGHLRGHGTRPRLRLRGRGTRLTSLQAKVARAARMAPASSCRVVASGPT
jgi:hypothetical protein